MSSTFILHRIGSFISFFYSFINLYEMVYELNINWFNIWVNDNLKTHNRPLLNCTHRRLSRLHQIWINCIKHLKAFKYKQSFRFFTHVVKRLHKITQSHHTHEHLLFTMYYCCNLVFYFLQKHFTVLLLNCFYINKIQWQYNICYIRMCYWRPSISLLEFPEILQSCWLSIEK